MAEESNQKKSRSHPTIVGLERLVKWRGVIFPGNTLEDLAVYLKKCEETFSSFDEYQVWLDALLPLFRKPYFYGCIRQRDSEKVKRTLRRWYPKEKKVGFFFCYLDYESPVVVKYVIRKDENEAVDETNFSCDQMNDLLSLIEKNGDEKGLIRRETNVFDYHDDQANDALDVELAGLSKEEEEK